MILKTATFIALLLAASAPAADQSAPPAPFPPLPSQPQLNWHKAEYIMFAHFGMKTFYPSNDRMGNGKEDPAKFNPAKFDANQWVEAAKAGGFKGIVLTCKHHDGFCNWATETTMHSVSSSPWKDGKGDVVKELADACRKGGVYFGICMSIIDKHFENAGSPNHPDYASYYYDQIKELSTKYGRIDGFWFDGYNAKNLKSDYPKFSKLIAETQPDAVVYDSGVLVKSIPDRCLSWPHAQGGVKPDQDYRKLIDGVMRWYPNEPSIILQGNWFHNGSPVSSLQTIQTEYLNSTGHSVTPLLNVSPNADGLIDEATVTRLKEFKAWVDQLHNNDLARQPGVKVTTDSHRGNSPKLAPANLTDGDYETYYATDDNVTTATIEIDLGGVREIDGFILQEYIPLGQRVDGYNIECRVNGAWTPVFAGKKIGYKRIILEGRSSAVAKQFPAADAVRIRINKAHACPLINNIQIIGKSS